MQTKRVHENERFDSFIDRGGAQVFSNITYRKCYFEGCWISLTDDPKARSTVRNVELIGCEMRGCTLMSAIVENVLVDGLKTNGIRQAFGAAYKNVVLRGKIGRVMLTKYVSIRDTDGQIERAFEHANRRYYEDVDWALDISEVQAEELDVRGIPARLIRRDPETQVIVTREKAMARTWERLDLSETYWPVALDSFLQLEGDTDIVFVAPKRSKRFPALLDGLRKLRDAGIAEPD